MRQSFFKKFRQRTLTVQLTWIYTLVSCGILTLTMSSLYYIFVDRLHKENTLFLNNKATFIQALSSDLVPNNLALKQEIEVEPLLYHYYARLLDDNGHIILETPGMSQIAPVSTFQVMPSGEWKSSRNHKHYLLFSTSSVQIAKDIHQQHEMIEADQQDIILILLIELFISAVVVIWVTRRGLKPLMNITHSIERVSTAQLKERLDPTDWPRELSHLANGFNQMVDRIEKGVGRLTQFSGDLAHELRTPINNLRGEAEVALSRPRTNEEYQKVLESSLEEFERLSRMINSLLFLARAENPQTAIILSEVDMDGLLQDIHDFYLVSAEEKNITIEYEKTCLRMKADRQLLGQALGNLVANALRYSPPGSNITLMAKQLGDQIIISVIDVGQGIPSQSIPRLFDRFYRLDSSRSWQTGGFGLGLSIVKSIMDLHQGLVKIASEVGKGTAVHLIFPSIGSERRI